MTSHNSDPTLPREKVVRVSTELLAQLREWSDPVQVQIVGEKDDELELVFRRVESLEHTLAKMRATCDRILAMEKK